MPWFPIFFTPFDWLFRFMWFFLSFPFSNSDYEQKKTQQRIQPI